MFGWGFLKRRTERKANQEAEARKAVADKLAEDRRRRVVERIFQYPVKEMTQQELGELPCGDAVTFEFLRRCQLGTWFVCKSEELAPTVIIIGQVVAGKDLFLDQHEAGLPVPLRGVNRYRAALS